MSDTASIAANIDDTLAQRGQRYGAFSGHARITQNIKRAMRDSPNWARLSDSQLEALEMVAHKIGRVLNGDPDYHDSWHDIIGYTKLVADELLPVTSVSPLPPIVPPIPAASVADWTLYGAARTFKPVDLSKPQVS